MKLSFEKVKSLPEILIPGTIYYVDNLKTQVIAESENTYSIYNGCDSPFEKGIGENSVVLKGTITNYAFGNNSVAIGKNTEAVANNSFVSGLRTKTKCSNGAAFGQDNVGNSDAIFEIGIGTSSDRKNAVEVKQNGDVYITGIGGFTGANSSTSKSVQEVINELVNIINEITISETN